jgi:hypothetical protein
MHTQIFRTGALLVLTLGLVSLTACQFTTANIERAVMARAVNEDNSPAEETASFHKYENLLHCCVEMANTPAGTKVKAVWRFDDGDEREIIDSTEVDVDASVWVDFTLALSESGLPYAKYAVDLYINGEFQQTVPFTIAPMFSESVIKEAVLATEINDSYYPVTVVGNLPHEYRATLRTGLRGGTAGRVGFFRHLVSARRAGWPPAYQRVQHSVRQPRLDRFLSFAEQRAPAGEVLRRYSP